MIYSDGGLAHCLTYHSVQLSLISAFVNLDLDMLIAARTAPGHSWANPVERLMSLLNLAYQNMANWREFCSADMDKKLKKCTGMVDIRKLYVSDEKFHEEWIKSLQPMTEVLNERTTRVALKGKKFEVRNLASEYDVATTEDSVFAKLNGYYHAYQIQF